MNYTAFSLNGAWEMKYAEEKYLCKENPFKSIHKEEDAAGTEPEDITSDIIEDAVPAYWEDMTEKFRFTSFFGKLRINPEYGLQSYPITGYAPDMALPNIVGTFFYRKKFDYPKESDEAELHFEGVQNTLYAWINDVFVGFHEGYSTPFDIKIPRGVLQKGENTIVLAVSNHRLKGYADEPVTGLTSRAANEYSGGITGNAEIREYLSPVRDCAVIVSKNLKTALAKVEMKKPCEFLWRVCDGEKTLKEGRADGSFSFDTEGLLLWSPEHPKLYTLKIICKNTSTEQKFGVRRLSAKNEKLYLNGKAYYLRGICEHCYFPETIHPNHNYFYYRKTIKEIKSLGFNFIRFHTFVPEEEYMRAADEEGVLLHVECPNNTATEEWEQIVKFCRRHTSVVIYCCGNELLTDEPFIKYLEQCGKFVHENTDALFSPMNALRGVEYFWVEENIKNETAEKPLRYHRGRMEKLGEFSDLYSSYTNGNHSYFSLDCDYKKVDSWSEAYKKPRISHEICIDGTYANLSLKDRYRGTRVGNTDMFESLERQLEKKGLLKKAPLYFINSAQWQRRIRKYTFEEMRKSRKMAGYDFLGPIDTHWHTFGYDVGMMNEFYELKPGETKRNVLMYNSPTVILTNLGKNVNFTGGDTLTCEISVSDYGQKELKNPLLTVRLSLENLVIKRETVCVENVKNGDVSPVYKFSCALPEIQEAKEMKLYVTLDSEDGFFENEWELYLFPKIKKEVNDNIVIKQKMTKEELIENLKTGKDVVLLGNEPFPALPTSFRIALAGRTTGNLATVINEHNVLDKFPHSGFCSWQFSKMLEGGSAVCFDDENVPFDPIIEVVSTHKYVIKQSAMFEFKALNARLFVCSLNFEENDSAANYLKEKIKEYVSGENFNPKAEIDEKRLLEFLNTNVRKAASNANLAFNENDKTAVRKNVK